MTAITNASSTRDGAADDRPARQWGADTRLEPLPVVPPRPGTRAIGTNRAAIWLIVITWALFAARVVKVGLLDRAPSWAGWFQVVLYLAVVTSLTASAVGYLVARHGFLARAQQHIRIGRTELDADFAAGTPSLTVLVPAYREEARVVRQTLLSAALQEYDDVSIVLLVDDPANPGDDDARRLLDDALALPHQVASMLAGPAEAARQALARFDRRSAGADATAHELGTLSAAFDHSADVLDDITRSLPLLDHTDDFLADQVIGRLSSNFRAVAEALTFAVADRQSISAERARELHLRLVRVFTAELSAFQRKRFASLSHEPNKAMNLNSYISLMGGTYRIVRRGDELHLLPSDEADADLVVPATELILTLDADSVLLPEYCLRLVHELGRPGNERIAVIQTPYSAFPGAPTRLERLSGATTDLQHRVHQGLTHFGATFWVGANAILRTAALRDIATSEMEHGTPRVRYIHDRTVIEDTESSIDLGVHGWTLHNHPERLSYSATPPDFGSLAIQRQRWADGGLIILPKLLRSIRTGRKNGEPLGFAQSFLRINYLASTAWSSLGLLLLLAYPFWQSLLSPLVVLAALPYFAAQASDLAACGYRRRDIVRIYGLNLLLLPVNLAGVLRSIGQGITGSKIAFARTPKRRNRTAARGLFIAFPLVLIAFSGYTVYKDILNEAWWHAAFAGLNASTTLWAVVALVGVRASVVDLFAGAVNFLTRAPEAAPVRVPERRDWAMVLDQSAA